MPKKILNPLLSKTINLKQLINYQKNSVVSLTLSNKKAGTLTLFAFGKGQGLSEHKAPYDAIIQIIEGEARITINKKRYLLKANELIIMPANIPHAVHAEKKFKMLLTMIRA